MNLNKKTIYLTYFYILSRIGCLFLLFILSFPILGQNVNFTQFHLSPAQTNPAMITMSNQSRVIFNYRSQSIAAGQVFATPMVTYIQPWIKERLYRKAAFGVSVLQDKTGEQGVLTTTGGLLTAAANLNLNPLSASEYKTYLSIGAQGGYFQRRVNPDVLTAGNQWDGSLGYNPNTPINENILSANANFPVISAGMMFYMADSCANTKAFFGFAAQNINRPNVGFFGEKVKQTMHFSLMGGINIYNQNNFKIQPNFRWVQQGTTNQIRIGSLFYYNFSNAEGALEGGNIGLGAWYDENGAMIMSLEFSQNNLFAGFSYDLGANNPTRSLGSTAMEFSVGIKFGKRCLTQRAGPKEREMIRDTSEIEVKNADGVMKYTIVALVKDGEVMQTDTIGRQFFPNEVALAIPTDEDLKIFKKQAFFYYLSDDISRSTASYLDQIAATMLKFKGIRIELAGHTCNIGDDNQTLSLNRAKAIQKYLTDKGVDANRFELVGFADKKPILANTTEYGRTKNRRVEFRVLSTGAQK
jgi:type IX secretion system PorP/SprF family membrane protein